MAVLVSNQEWVYFLKRVYTRMQIELNHPEYTDDVAQDAFDRLYTETQISNDTFL